MPKKGDFAAVFSQNQMYQFTGEGVFSKKTSFSLGLLLQSGLEVKIGKYVNIDDLSIISQKDSILNNKINFIVSEIRKIDNNFKF